jgi:hypothetical protein
MTTKRLIIPAKKPLEFPDVATLYFLLYVEIGKIHLSVTLVWLKLKYGVRSKEYGVGFRKPEVGR